MKNAVDIIETLCYKLRMLGLIINVPTDIFGDSEAICANTTWPESLLTKKQHIIAYHHIQEAVAEGAFRLSKEHRLTNLDYSFTKTMEAPSMDDLWAILCSNKSKLSLWFFYPN